MSWPMPRPPGTPDLNKLEKMIRPQEGGDSDPSKDPEKPEGPKTPHKYSMSDHIYVAILRGPLAKYRPRFPPPDIQAKLQAGDIEGISQEYQKAWRIRSNPRVAAQIAMWNEETDRYARNEPLLNESASRSLAFSVFGMMATGYSALLFTTWKVAGWGWKRLFNRAPAAKTQNEMRMAGNGNQSNIGSANQAVPGPVSSTPSALEFYQRPTMDAGARVEHLIQRELYLRELFRHK